ncbi:MAG: trypsin-like serine peptidase [Streptosporangiaceae bacterium]
MAGPLSLVVAVIAALWPGGHAAPASTAPSAIAASIPTAKMTAVGALFTESGGKLRSHFCTASVVDSPGGNVLITAAHCVTGYSDTSPALAFVPGYNGTAPLGIWSVTRIFTDRAWAATANPNDDVAFLTVAQPGSNMPVESVAGAERLDIGRTSTDLALVIGYPDTQNQPLSCENPVTVFTPSQLEFDCDGYTDGTSGGPFLIDVNPATGEGAVIGVIGGYQRGGDSADVSYAAAFGQRVQTLYDVAVAVSQST